jgi:hypothetical protein
MTATRFRIAGQDTELEFRPDGSVVQTSLASPPQRRSVAETGSRRWHGQEQGRAGGICGRVCERRAGGDLSARGRDSALTIKSAGVSTGICSRPGGDVFAGAYLVRFTR